MSMIKKNVLGRGLDALISMDEVSAAGSSSINDIALSSIEPNSNQPRTNFDEESLEELAQSIRALGVIQPITLREISDNKYQIIAGERRYRASLLAGKETIPAYIKTAKDENVVEMALIENIQREDLNAIEIALTYQKLIEQYGLTQEKLSERIGKNRATIANFLRLLKLPAEIQLGITNKTIDNGHARALLPLNDAEAQLSLYDIITQYDLSVRKVEQVVKDYNSGNTGAISDLLMELLSGGDGAANKGADKSKADNKKKLPEEYGLLEKHLSKFFETKVQFTCDEKGGGKISIPFKTEEELERIIGIFDKLTQ